MSYKITITNSDLTTSEFNANYNETILTAALNAGLAMPHSCNLGVCGACKCKLVKGEVVHQDYNPLALTDDQLASNMILACRAIAKKDSEIELLKPASGIFLTKVYTINKLENSMILKLKLIAKTPFNILPGQYIEVSYKNITRCYSVANLPNHDGFIELYIRRNKGGALSEILWNQLEIGDSLRVKGPFGNFTLRKQYPSPIFMACTGTGFAPIKALIQAIIYRADDKENLNTSYSPDAKPKVILIWGNSQLDFEYWQETLLQLQESKTIDLSIHLCSRKGFSKFASHIANSINYYQGSIVEFISSNHDDLREYMVYTCGNQDTISKIKQLATQLGVCQNNFFADTFLPLTS